MSSNDAILTVAQEQGKLNDSIASALEKHSQAIHNTLQMIQLLQSQIDMLWKRIEMLERRG